MEMIIINNYEMPANCYMCDLQNYHECDLTGKSIEEDYCWNGDSREKHCPLREVEAIPKADYENRLKADMVAMLTEIQLEIEEMKMQSLTEKEIWNNAIGVCSNLVQQKIDKLKGGENETKDNNSEK
ncbi:hypothetical protein [Butyrivibrio sp.]|uniref:hypothetical protein n=1 Tax=Butyrivibrio sp. TaxID=28121 RepID=UPI0025BA44BB|nr:hypothetical protein [Butyrivibrio sp.]MBQ7428361.1 hypothetical protein [Butyrivibrio sp.]MBQ9303665.1 hypothetical protein [Butyrivibrio sp.]